MKPAPFVKRDIVQLAYVVRDIDAAVDHWVRAMGAGPFYYTPVMSPSEQVFRGRPTEVSFRIAVGYAGDVQIEILRQENDAPSPFLELWESKGAAQVPTAGWFHHMQLAHDDYDAAYADVRATGAQVCFDATIPGVGPMSFLDARAQMDCYVELVQPTPARLHSWTRMHEIHRVWDGERPRREFAELFEPAK